MEPLLIAATQFRPHHLKPKNLSQTSKFWPSYSQNLFICFESTDVLMYGHVSADQLVCERCSAGHKTQYSKTFFLMANLALHLFQLLLWENYFDKIILLESKRKYHLKKNQSFCLLFQKPDICLMYIEIEIGIHSSATVCFLKENELFGTSGWGWNLLKVTLNIEFVGHPAFLCWCSLLMFFIHTLWILFLLCHLQILKVVTCITSQISNFILKIKVELLQDCI